MLAAGKWRGAGRAIVAGASLLCAFLLIADRTPDAAIQDRSPEVRALWVLRSSLSSPASIKEMVRSARENGFNTLLVQVRGRGDAYYLSSLEPRAAELQRQPVSFDPLATVLEEARAAKLSVHAWVNVNLISSAVDLPIARNHIILRHPTWLMVPRELAEDLARVKPGSPAYVGRLARWARSQSEEVEGLYASPIIPAAAAHTEAVVREIARRYAVDGIHLDYARFPSVRFDYSAGTLAAFKATVRPKLTPAVRRDLDTGERTNPFAYPDGLSDEWKAFRIAGMTALMGRLRTAIKTERPNALVTLAAAPDIHEAYNQKLQDWRSWLVAGLVDAVAPMAYTPEPARFAEQIAAARDVVGGKSVWAGIGAFRLTAAQTIDNINTARRLGTAGVVLFSYDSLIDPRQSPSDYLATIGKLAFASSTAAEGSQ
jgi:uncharacterized lipoprotein YddW (UPF0748 family)